MILTLGYSRKTNFYVIVGSSAGALTGLQFVVMALISDTQLEGTMAEINAFGTPTIVHFCAVLLVAALMSAPWTNRTALTIALDCVGVAGVVYALIVLHRTRRQTGYKPVVQDWLWHCLFPLISYLCIGSAAIFLTINAILGLFLLATVEIFLLFI